MILGIAYKYQMAHSFPVPKTHFHNGATMNKIAVVILLMTALAIFAQSPRSRGEAAQGKSAAATTLAEQCRKLEKQLAQTRQKVKWNLDYLRQEKVKMLEFQNRINAITSLREEDWRKTLADAEAEAETAKVIRCQREMLVGGDGVEREFLVLWVGNARGYAVNAKAKQAGVGRWMDGHWRWSWDAEWVPLFQQAIECAQGEQSAVLRMPL